MNATQFFNKADVDAGPAGSYVVVRDGLFDYDMYCKCPCGCGAVRNWDLSKDPEGPMFWNNNKSQPTITPSIRVREGCFFHGTLTDGVWSFEPDSGVAP